MSKADTKGNHHLHIELTPAQYQLLTEKARQCGLTKRVLYLLDQVYELMYPIAKSRVVYGCSVNHRTAQCARQAAPMGQTSSLN